MATPLPQPHLPFRRRRRRPYRPGAARPGGHWGTLRVSPAPRAGWGRWPRSSPWSSSLQTPGARLSLWGDFSPEAKGDRAAHPLLSDRGRRPLSKARNPLSLAQALNTHHSRPDLALGCRAEDRLGLRDLKVLRRQKQSGKCPVRRWALVQLRIELGVGDLTVSRRHSVPMKLLVTLAVWDTRERPRAVKAQGLALGLWIPETSLS